MLNKKEKKSLIKNNNFYYTLRLNSYLANSGISSRRKSDIFIKKGMVKVNDKVIKDFNIRVSNKDRVVFDGNYIYPEKKVYIILNKPKKFLTTTKNEKYRKNIMDLLPKSINKRIYPVGRLDYNTTGILLITNDGYLSEKLTHPRYNLKKIYNVILNRKLHNIDKEKILKGIRLNEGIAKVDKILIKNENEIIIELHIGWNRIIRRIFQKLNYKIIELDRIFFCGINKNNVKIGEWRFLKKHEINMLKTI